MLWPQSAAQWHAALNDFPSLLFVLAFAFELAALAAKRESLRTVALWSLSVGVGGSLVALFSGLRAANLIDHGGSVHLVMARHQTLAVAITILFAGLAVWRIWRRTGMRSRERSAFLTVSGLGVVALLWTTHLGGAIVYEYGGGVPTEVLEGALQERQRGHTHESAAGTDAAPNGEVPSQSEGTAHQHD